MARSQQQPLPLPSSMDVVWLCGLAVQICGFQGNNVTAHNPQECWKLSISKGATVFKNLTPINHFVTSKH